MFPQRGHGLKHERAIVLADWQRAIVDRFPEQFVRGLIHSDGCRTVNRFKAKLPGGRVAEYEYPRYFFSNLLGRHPRPVLRVLRAAWSPLDAVDHRNISVSHRDSVRILDGFIGPKT